MSSRARTVAAVAAILYDASGTRIGGGVLFPSVINDIDEFAASMWSSESSGGYTMGKRQRALPRIYILRINLGIPAKFGAVEGATVSPV